MVTNFLVSYIISCGFGINIINKNKLSKKHKQPNNKENSTLHLSTGHQGPLVV